jgi:hypothetical protein
VHTTKLCTSDYVHLERTTAHSGDASSPLLLLTEIPQEGLLPISVTEGKPLAGVLPSQEVVKLCLEPMPTCVLLFPTAVLAIMLEAPLHSPQPQEHKCKDKS